MLPFRILYKHDGSEYDGQELRPVEELQSSMDENLERDIITYTDTRLKIIQTVSSYKEKLKEYRLVAENIQQLPVDILLSQPLQIEIPNDDYEIEYFNSRWSEEFDVRKEKLGQSFCLENRRGRSSNECFPQLYIKKDGKYLLNVTVAWSGNWKVEVKKSDSGYIISAGISDWEFTKRLNPHQSFDSMTAVVAYSSDGTLDSIAKLYTDWGRAYNYLQNDVSRELPIEWNHWWPYEDVEVNEKNFRENVDEASEMGFEAVLLDAGWFGSPENAKEWYQIRGDWHVVNTERFPSGIKALSRHVHSKGLKFGIWCEIEALGVNAELRKLHDDFDARRDGESLNYVCFGSPAVREWAFSTLEHLICEYEADWIKLDFNLDPLAGCNRTDHGHDAGDGLYEHYRGYYEVLDKIRTRYPHVLLENCSSGGLRIDLEMLKHTYCTYISDSDVTAKKLNFYRGALVTLAPNVCLHWSWSHTRWEINNGNGPFPPLDLVKGNFEDYQIDYHIRAGMMGWFGLSHRLPELSDRIKERIKDHIAFYKEHIKDFIRKGNVYKLQPVGLDEGIDTYAAQYVIEQEGRSAIFVFNKGDDRDGFIVRPKALEPGARYEIVSADGGAYFSSNAEELIVNGILLGPLRKEESRILLITKK